jgi:hypothetical protein
MIDASEIDNGASERTHISLRAGPTRRAAYLKAAERIGLKTLSEWVFAVLDGAAGRIRDDQWISRLVYVKNGAIVAVGEAPRVGDVLPDPVPGWPVLAPEAFWEAIENKSLD